MIINYDKISKKNTHDKGKIVDNNTELFKRLIENIDSEAVRIQIANTLPELSILSERNLYAFKELLEKYMTYKDGKEQVSKKWRAIYQNSPSPTVPLSVMLQDENVKREAFESMEFLINYGDFRDSAPLAEVIGSVEGGAHVIANNFEEFFANCLTDLSAITLPCMETPLGRRKIKDNFDRIKGRYSENQWDTSIRGFFETVKRMKGHPEFAEEYKKYGYLAQVYEEAGIPTIQFKDPMEVLELAKQGYDFSEANMLSGARFIKDESFVALLKSPDLEEKMIVLKEISKGQPFRFKSTGSTSLILQTGDMIVKIGAGRRKYEVPYHPRIMMPYFRKRYQDGSCIEVFNYGDTKSADITDEKLLEIYKELEDAGILWGDARKENLVVLKKDNILPDYIASDEFNVMGFLEHPRFPTNKHKPLKKGDIVVCDLDMLYVKGDPNYQRGIFDDVVYNYIDEQERNGIYARSMELDE